MTDDREQLAGALVSALDSQARDRLRIIAENLECSVDVFFDEGAAVGKTAALSELLGLWHAAASCSTRQRILEFARQEVAASND